MKRLVAVLASLLVAGCATAPSAAFYVTPQSKIDARAREVEAIIATEVNRTRFEDRLRMAGASFSPGDSPAQMKAVVSLMDPEDLRVLALEVVYQLEGNDRILYLSTGTIAFTKCYP